LLVLQRSRLSRNRSGGTIRARDWSKRSWSNGKAAMLA
jgi:hypothetical protein